MLHIRQASLQDVLALRHQVLRPGLPHESAQFDDDLQPTTRHWVADFDHRIVGVASVMERPHPSHDLLRYQLRGMAVEPILQQTGIGHQLLMQIYRDVATSLWCNARTTAQHFYIKHGWQPISTIFDIPGVGPHLQMMISLPSKNRK